MITRLPLLVSLLAGGPLASNAFAAALGPRPSAHATSSSTTTTSSRHLSRFFTTEDSPALDSSDGNLTQAPKRPGRRALRRAGRRKRSKSTTKDSAANQEEGSIDMTRTTDDITNDTTTTTPSMDTAVVDSTTKAARRPGRRKRIKADEKVVFFPTAARRGDDGTSWDIPIHGWIFEPETRDLARRAFILSLRKYLKLERDSDETQILKRRVGPFLVDNESRKELSIRIGCSETDDNSCRVFQLPKSGKNGHFEALLHIDDAELQQIQQVCNSLSEENSPGGVLQFEAVTEESDERSFKGKAHFIPATGLSVISDIDDTVKHTGVGNKKELLRSTFMEEFREVPGMAQLYQTWAADLDARFHFVSSSPWQLWLELESFLSNTCGFPQATYHLKPIRLKDRTLMNLWKSPLETKIAVIESILDGFPQRKFLLVGDTGEKDPEVYGEIARRYPKQIKGIYVRNVTNETGVEERYDEAFADLDPSIWALFNEPQDIELSSSVLESVLEMKAEVEEATLKITRQLAANPNYV